VPPPFDAQARVPRRPVAVRSTRPSGPRLGRGQARARSGRTAIGRDDRPRADGHPQGTRKEPVGDLRRYAAATAGCVQRGR